MASVSWKAEERETRPAVRAFAGRVSLELWQRDPSRERGVGRVSRSFEARRTGARRAFKDTCAFDNHVRPCEEAGIPEGMGGAWRRECHSRKTNRASLLGDEGASVGQRDRADERQRRAASLE